MFLRGQPNWLFWPQLWRSGFWGPGWQTRYAHRASTRVVAEIKNGVLTSAAAMSPRDLDPRRDEIATVVTRGVDGLGPYLTGYSSGPWSCR